MTKDLAWEKYCSDNNVYSPHRRDCFNAGYDYGAQSRDEDVAELRKIDNTRHGNEMAVLKKALERQIKLAEKWQNRFKDELLTRKALKASNAVLQDAADRYKAENERLREEIEALLKEIKELKDAKIRHSEEVDELKNDMDNVVSYNEALKAENERLRVELDQAWHDTKRA